MKSTRQKKSARRPRASSGSGPGAKSGLVQSELKFALEEIGVAQRELEFEAMRGAIGVLEVSQQRFADLYDFAPVGYLTLDHNGSILAINATCAAMLNRNRRQLLRIPFVSLVAESDRRKFLNHLARLRRGQRQVSTEMMVGSGGQYTSVQVVSVRGGPSGYPRSFSTALVNLSDERQHAEQALRESEARFLLLADSAPVMIWLSGPDKRSIYFNPRWLEFTGKTLQQGLEAGWSQGIHPDDLNACLETYLTA